MAKAISTKFLPAGNRRGSQIKATDGDGNTVFVDYEHALNHDERHAYAAFRLVQKMGWHGFYVGGGTKTGEVFVKAAGDGRFPQAAMLVEQARSLGDPFGFERANWFYVPDPKAGEHGAGKFNVPGTEWGKIQ